MPDVNESEEHAVKVLLDHGLTLSEDPEIRADQIVNPEAFIANLREQVEARFSGTPETTYRDREEARAATEAESAEAVSVVPFGGVTLYEITEGNLLIEVVAHVSVIVPTKDDEQGV